MKVLVIDDSALTRKMIINSIEQEIAGATFDQAKDGDEALDMLNASNYDVFTIDYNMPGANGEIVAIAAKTRCPKARICMLTSRDETEMRNRIERIGVKFLQKPDFEAELVEFIRNDSGTP